jgi:photosystem II stability/assembly factor-like uncharacterized protein
MRHIKTFLITILSIVFLILVAMVPVVVAETPTSALERAPAEAIPSKFDRPVHDVEMGSDRTLWMIADRSADLKEGNALYRCPFDETSRVYGECEKILAIDGEWQPVPLDAMAVNPQNPSHIIVGIWNAVVQSKDGGSTWASTILTYGGQREVIDGSVNDVLFLGESTYLATTRGVFYSDDGRNWDRYGENLVSDVRKLAMLPANLKLGGGEALTAYGYGPAVWQYMSQHGQWVWIEVPVNTGEQSEVFYFGRGGWSDPFLTFAVREEWWEASVVILSPANRSYPQKVAASSLNRPGDSRGSRWPLCGAVSPSGLAVLGTDEGLYSSTDRGQSWQKVGSFGDAQINDVMTIEVTITSDLSEGKFLIGSDQGLEVWPSD